MSEQRKKLKTWQGWAIFGGAMVFVFCLGLLAASITNRRAEITTIYANKKDKIAKGEAKNPMYQGNYPVSTRRGHRQPIQVSEANSTVAKPSMYWSNVPIW